MTETKQFEASLYEVTDAKGNSLNIEVTVGSRKVFVEDTGLNKIEIDRNDLEKTLIYNGITSPAYSINYVIDRGNIYINDPITKRCVNILKPKSTAKTLGKYIYQPLNNGEIRWTGMVLPVADTLDDAEDDEDEDEEEFNEDEDEG